MMNVSVGKDLEDFARGKVASGDYASVSEVVREGLRLLKERDRLLEARLHALRREAPAGPDPAAEGDPQDG